MNTCTKSGVTGSPCTRESMPDTDHCAWHTPEKLAARQSKEERKMARKQSSRDGYARKHGTKTQELTPEQANDYVLATRKKYADLVKRGQQGMVFNGTPKESRDLIQQAYPGFHPLLGMVDFVTNPQPVVDPETGDVVMMIPSLELRSKMLATIARYTQRPPAQEREAETGENSVSYDIHITADGQTSQAVADELPTPTTTETEADAT